MATYYEIENKDTGELYAGGYGTNKGIEWTKNRHISSFGSRKDMIPILNLLKKKGYNVRLK